MVELECGVQIRIKPDHLQLAGAGMTDEEEAGTAVTPSAENVLEQMFCDDGAQRGGGADGGSENSQEQEFQFPHLTLCGHPIGNAQGNCLTCTGELSEDGHDGGVSLSEVPSAADNIDAQQQREAAEEYRERRRGVEAAVAAAQEASGIAAAVAVASNGAGRTRNWTEKQKLALALFGEGRSLALLGFAGTGKTVRCRAYSLVSLNHADVCALTVVCRPLSWRCCDVLRARMPLG